MVLAGCGGGRAFTRAVRRVRGSGRGYGGGIAVEVWRASWVGWSNWFGVSFFPFWSERDGVRNACTRDPDLWAHKIAFRCGTN